MKKKVFACLFFLIFFVILVIIVSNKKVANQIIIGVEDIYEDVTNKSEDVENTEDIQKVKINELQPQDTIFYYNMLTDEQKKIYNALVVAIKNLDKKAKIKDYSYTDDYTTMQDVKLVMENLFLDHPEIFYVGNDYSVSTISLINSKRIEINLEYLVNSKEELNNQISKINDTLDPIITEAKVMEKFDAELYIHDKISELCSYYKYDNIDNVSPETHSIYGCFVNKSAVCDGLSKAFQIALDKVGINNILITGYLQDQAHAWNLVNLNNNWYHVDITSDKSISNDEKINEQVIHSYFNITTEMISKTNTIDIEDKLPIADKTDDNYYIKTDKFISKNDNFYTKIKQILDNNKNEKLFEFAVDSNIKSVPEKLVYVLQDSKYDKYTNKKENKFNYYNVLNSYILLINN